MKVLIKMKQGDGCVDYLLPVFAILIPTPSRDLVKEVNTGPEASSSKKPKASMHVKYELHIGQGNTATALSKQLKRQGKYGQLDKCSS